MLPWLRKSAPILEGLASFFKAVKSLRPDYISLHGPVRIEFKFKRPALPGLVLKTDIFVSAKSCDSHSQLSLLNELSSEANFRFPIRVATGCRGALIPANSSARCKKARTVR